MTGLPSLLGALGLVALLFALVSFLVAILGVTTDLGWILTNLGVGVVMLGTAAVLNLDALRERMRSGEARRAGKYGSSAVLASVLAIAILGMLGFLATRYHVRWDWSEQRVHSLSDQSLKVLENLDRDVQVVALFSPLDAPPVRAILERYDYASDRFEVVEFADPNARPDLLAKYEITPEKLGRGLLRMALGDESVEVVASHIRMDIEQIGNLRGGHGLEGLTNRDVDPATSRVAERGGEVGDLLIKRFGIHAVPVEILGDRSSL